MFQAIAAVIGLADGANRGAQAQYAQTQDQYQYAIINADNRTNTYYTAFGQSGKMLMAAVIGSIVLLILGIYLISKKK